MFFLNKRNQIARIKNKLKTVTLKDKDFSVFGSSFHKYQVNTVLSKKELTDWERRNQVKLPVHFAQFLTEVGNGGAGPYYGVYTIEKVESYTDKSALTAKSSLYPNMPKDEWNRLVEPLISDEDTSDDLYDVSREKILGGMLCFGTQGCEYDMYIVLEGKYAGRVVYTTDFYKDSPFFFVYEDNFLDWYECWLDEIILDYDISWYGCRMPGDEHTLMKAYMNSNDKSAVLHSMFKFKKLSRVTIDFLKGIADQRNDKSVKAVNLICKASFEDSRNYIQRMMKSEKDEDFLNALKTLNWYGKEENLEEFIQLITNRRINDPEILRFVGYILGAKNRITLDYYEQFLCNTDLKIQKIAIFATRVCEDKLNKIDIIERMLADGNSEVMKEYILYWGLVPHESLLPYYKAAWPEYKNNKNFIVKFYDCLKALGLPEDYFEL